MQIRTEEKKDWAAVHKVNVSAFEVPEEAFMLLELHPVYLRGASGKVESHAAFKDV